MQLEIELLRERIREVEERREKTTKEKKKELELKHGTQRREPTRDLRAVGPSGSGNQDEIAKQQSEAPRNQAGSQEHRLVETHATKASTPSQPKRKSYAQVAKENTTRSLSEKPWTEVRYINKKQGASPKQAQKQKPGGRRILFPRKEAQPKRSQEDIMLALNEALQKAGKAASI